MGYRGKRKKKNELETIKKHIMIFGIIVLAVSVCAKPAAWMNPKSIITNRPFAMNQQELERQIMARHNRDLRRMTDKYLLDRSIRGSLRNLNKRLLRDIKFSEMRARIHFKERMMQRSRDPSFKKMIKQWKKLERRRERMVRMSKLMIKERPNYSSLYSMPIKGDIRFPTRKYIYRISDHLLHGPSELYDEYVRPDGDIAADDIDTDTKYWANKYFTRKSII